MAEQRVLLVEPDPMLRGLFQEILDLEGLDVTVYDSITAVEAATRTEVAGTIALGDFAWMHGPGDWPELLRRLGQRLPVVLVTDHPGTRQATPDSVGVAALLPKPFDLDELLKTIRRLGAAQRNSWMSGGPRVLRHKAQAGLAHDAETAGVLELVNP